ncbi:MAG TPA: FKBP-type peptidyl-prolyl cis-trans isomerase [Chitinophagales bacterium]|nr:FKBP-type peptidyl-prolyl cis-trans isomerase [Chitinophagales bacterium]
MINQLTYTLLVILALTACKNKQTTDNDKTEVFNESQYLKSNLNEKALSLIQEFGSEVDSLAYIEEIKTISNLVQQKENQNDIHFTPSGVVYIIHKKGDGPTPQSGDVLSVQVETLTLDSIKIFSTSDLQQSLHFVLDTDQIVPAWNVVFPHIQEGSELEIISPSAMSYGKNGYIGSVSPNTILSYQVKFEKILATSESNETSSETPGLTLEKDDKNKSKKNINLTK